MAKKKTLKAVKRKAKKKRVVKKKKKALKRRKKKAKAAVKINNDAPIGSGVELNGIEENTIDDFKVDDPDALIADEEMEMADDEGYF